MISIINGNPKDKTYMTKDEIYMSRCLQLARCGMRNAQPNPMVGAVIVHDDRIIGEGYHVRCGKGHAEVNAFASVKAEDECLLHDATIYVSLEPCAHYGKTPPCADLIVSKGVKRCVVGCVDPFAKVQGRGIQKLLDAGIEVTTGVLEAECMALNERFMTFHSKRRPLVTLKWAQSADGYIDDDSDAPAVISNAMTQMICHKRRAEHQAILVGRNTALKDNPSLSTREWPGDSPVRIVIDRNDSLPHGLRLYDGSVRTLVVTDKDLSTGLRKGNAEYVSVDFGEDIIPQLMECLYDRGVQTLLVEGGRQLLQSFIDAGMWDRCFVETGTCILGGGVEAPVVKNATKASVMSVLCHNIVEYTPNLP